MPDKLQKSEDSRRKQMPKLKNCFSPQRRKGREEKKANEGVRRQEPGTRIQKKESKIT
jgi:hypothetical protein